MSWRQLTESVQSLAAHILLFTTTLFLVLKLDHTVSYSWGVIFAPLWPFHAFMARARFSLPAPSIPHDRHHFWVAISMVFLVAATTFTLLKLSGYVSSLGWWDLFLNYGYNPFCGYPPEVVKKMPKKDLAEEVWTCGDYNQLLASKLKPQNIASRSLKGFKL